MAGSKEYVMSLVGNGGAERKIYIYIPADLTDAEIEMFDKWLLLLKDEWKVAPQSGQERGTTREG